MKEKLRFLTPARSQDLKIPDRQHRADWPFSAHFGPQSEVGCFFGWVWSLSPSINHVFCLIVDFKAMIIIQNGIP